MKNCLYRWGDGWTRYPQSFVNAQVHRRWLGVHYIGDKRGIEHQEILKSGLDVTFHSIATGKLRRYFSWQNMLDVFKVGWGIVQSLFIMLRLRPQALFQREALSLCHLLSQHVFQECQSLFTNLTLSMGLANKIAYKFATKMYSTFGASFKFV